MNEKIKSIFFRLFHTDWWLYTIVAVGSILLIFGNLNPSADTETYVDAWLNSWSKGEMDSFRTPLYPYYIGFMMTLSREHFMIISAIGQHVIFIVSLYYLKRMLGWFTNRHILINIAILAFAIFVIRWHNYIITESFAISGIIFLFYSLFSFYRSGGRSCIFLSVVWLLFLVFLRPAFLYLFPVCFLAYGLFYVRKIKNALLGLLGVLIVGLLDIGYCKCFEEKFGFFLPSIVSIENGFQIAVVEGVMSPDYANDEDVKEYLRTISVFEGKHVFDLWHYMCSNPIPDALDVKEKGRLLEVSRHQQRGKWLLSYWHHYYAFVTTHFPKNNSLSSIIYLIAAGVALMLNELMIIYFIFCCYMVFIKKKVPVVGIILWTAIMGNLATIIIGAQEEWYRLFLPSAPLLTLIIVQMLGLINWKSIASYDEDVAMSK